MEHMEPLESMESLESDIQPEVEDFVPPETEMKYESKGQLISKCPFGVKTSSKKPTIFFQDFRPSL